MGMLLLKLSAFAEPADNTIKFNRDIRPILSENCFACHGHDKNQRKADLRLDLREVAVEKGAIVPGKPTESKLVERIFAEDEDDRMPPVKNPQDTDARSKGNAEAMDRGGRRVRTFLGVHQTGSQRTSQNEKLTLG